MDNFVFCVDNYKNYPHFDKNNFCQISWHLPQDYVILTPKREINTLRFLFVVYYSHGTRRGKRSRANGEHGAKPHTPLLLWGSARRKFVRWAQNGGACTFWQTNCRRREWEWQISRYFQSGMKRAWVNMGASPHTPYYITIVGYCKKKGPAARTSYASMYFLTNWLPAPRAEMAIFTLLPIGYCPPQERVQSWQIDRS